jgi:hypothetical protein
MTHPRDLWAGRRTPACGGTGASIMASKQQGPLEVAAVGIGSRQHLTLVAAAATDLHWALGNRSHAWERGI